MKTPMDFEPRQSPSFRNPPPPIPICCHLCHQISTQTTTLNNCGHQFCRECLTQKLTGEHPGICPVCKLPLATSSGEKHKEKKQSVLPKKLAPLSSPLVSAQNQNGSSSSQSSAIVITPTGDNGIRRSSRKRILIHPTLPLSSGEESEEGEKEDGSHSYNKTTRIRNKRTKQNGSSSKYSKQQSSRKGKEPMEEGNLYNFRNIVVSLAAAPLPLPPQPTTTDGYQYKARQEEKGKEKMYDSNPITSIITQEKRREVIEDLNLPAAENEMVLESSSKLMWTREIPVWFNLVPCQNQNSSAAALPPLPSNYLKVKNNVPVSIIKKYLVLKFGLQCEDEVEINLSGLPIPPEMPMQDLLKAWVQTRRESKTTVQVGSSAKDFIMVVFYSLKPSAYARAGLANRFGSDKPII